MIEIVFDLKPDGVDFQYRMEVPEGYMPKLSYRLNLLVPPVLKYETDTKLFKGVAAPQGVPYDRIEAALKDYTLTVTPPSGKSTTLSFHTPQSGSLVGSKSIVFSGPFSRRKIEAIGPASGTGSVLVWFYDGRALYEGTAIRFNNQEEAPAGSPPAVYGIRFK